MKFFSIRLRNPADIFHFGFVCTFLLIDFKLQTVAQGLPVILYG